MKINIAGKDGAFGSFLTELLAPHFEILTWEEFADIIILAIPASQYDSFAFNFPDKHLINVCSIQSTTTNDLLKYTKNVTSIHPLFGRRTPAEKRNSILTFESHTDLEKEFLEKFRLVSTIIDSNLSLDSGMWKRFTPDLHDQLMAKTHLKAVQAAQLIKPFVTDTKDIPDELIPNSFRLLRDFVKTLDDMPKGTLESILANPYA